MAKGAAHSHLDAKPAAGTAAPVAAETAAPAAAEAAAPAAPAEPAA
jgi:hypothetical protein